MHREGRLPVVGVDFDGAEDVSLAADSFVIVGCNAIEQTSFKIGRQRHCARFEFADAEATFCANAVATTG